MKSKRKKVRKALVDAKDAAADRKLFLRSQKVVARLLKDRADHARAIIEWDVEPHHTADFIKRNRGHPDLDPSHLSIEDELKAGASDKHRKEVLKQNYHCITTGWGYSQYKCCFSGTSTCSLCKCCCGGDSAFKKGGHMEVSRGGGGGKQMQLPCSNCNVLVFFLLEARHQVDPNVGEGGDTETTGSYPADLTLRGFGSFSIGERTSDAIQRDEKRRQMRKRTMADVRTRPEKYSPIVPFTDVAADLIGQKIEARWYVPDDDAPGGRHFHCFEGTIKEIIPYSATRAN